MKSRKLRAKREKNQYYSDDEDSVTSDELEHRNVVQQTEKEMGLTDLGARLRKYANEEMEGKLSESEKDFHPGSKGQVLDLVHPSLYCYVDGQSQLVDGKVTDEIRAFFKDRNDNTTRARQIREDKKYGRIVYDDPIVYINDDTQGGARVPAVRDHFDG